MDFFDANGLDTCNTMVGVAGTWNIGVGFVDGENILLSFLATTSETE